MNIGHVEPLSSNKFNKFGRYEAIIGGDIIASYGRRRQLTSLKHFNQRWRNIGPDIAVRVRFDWQRFQEKSLCPHIDSNYTTILGRQNTINHILCVMHFSLGPKPDGLLQCLRHAYYPIKDLNSTGHFPIFHSQRHDRTRRLIEGPTYQNPECNGSYKLVTG